MSVGIPRRRFLATGGAASFVTAGQVLLGPVLLGPDGAVAAVRAHGGAPVPAGLFTLGVASGDPSPGGFVLWTRLAPRPVDGGGMPDRAVPVAWQIADDERFRQIRAAGVATARPEHGHAVHVEAGGLRPDREYFYRFRAGPEISPVGRARTAPRPGAGNRRLRFAFASCHNWQDGYFTAYHHLAQEDLAFVAFLGDYIYETVPRTDTVRAHEGTGEPYTLVEYRNRHAQYKTDPALQAAHAAFPWIVTWDDHEVDNNWADEIPQDPDRQPREKFLARRAAAFQAYYEHMPLRRPAVPHGIGMRLHRRLGFGRLAAVHVLDTRQYRSDQPDTLAEAGDPRRTMTGTEQERWLTGGLARSGARWNLLANQVMWASNDRKAGPEQVFDFDNWDGYRVQRRRMLEFFGSGLVSNPVVLTGDRHATWVCDLRPDFDDPASPVVGAEITGTSVSSGGDADPVSFHRTFDPIMAESPHWKYIGNQRGYVVCDVGPDRLLASLRTVDSVWRPDGTTAATAARFQVEAGRPGITVVDRRPAVDAGSRSETAPRRFAVDDDQL
ncbi:alkaline phosphatase D family protein [Actinomadura graeca]|uniref:Alkaline phosphatase D family protein n=1 Tax=Actinomadura graeca TaxID=2750812 RepID=A0ABX8R429_9ACTN|nr:alkaline phosphatase D family protein [Actinomadura graeca]QXJ25603.1 alkaline phosphatase D family protein [Actinomadura graeca]